MLKPIAATVGQVADQAASTTDESVITNVFKVFHGYYGNLFLSKFATGTVSNGEDEGIANARRIWAHGLRRFDQLTVKAALATAQTTHPEWPPSLPQFTALCMASRPRKVFQSEKALPMGQELRSAYARRAREVIARHAARQQQGGEVRQLPASLDGLKQAIADAVGLAGGDESATLLQLDRMLAPRAAT